jgi:hypothetical protein
MQKYTILTKKYMKITIEKLKMETREREFDFYYFPKEKLKGGNAIKISVYYDMGGMNYFQGQTEQRGYYFSFGAVDKGDHSETQQAFSGSKILMQEANKYSLKVLQKLRGDLQGWVDENADLIISTIQRK